MSGNGGAPGSIDFVVDKENLYQEKTITDLKIASIRQLSPVNLDGTKDSSREVIYIGSTQLGTPQGPVPIQAKLEASSLEEAMDAFPRAMEIETQKVVESFQRMQEAQKKSQDSRIIMPGMQ